MVNTTSEYYQLSRQLKSITEQAQGLTELWAWRYHVICDNSSKGESCPYAIQALRRSLTNEERTGARQGLLALKASVTEVLAVLDHGFDSGDTRLEEVNALIN